MRLGKGKKDKKKKPEVIPELGMEDITAGMEAAELEGGELNHASQPDMQEQSEAISEEAVMEEEIIEKAESDYNIADGAVSGAVMSGETAEVMPEAGYDDAAGVSQAVSGAQSGEESAEAPIKLKKLKKEKVKNEDKKEKISKEKIKKEKIKKEKTKRVKHENDEAAAYPVSAEQLNNNGKVNFFQSLLFKLIAGFMLPVICVIILGFISYNKAADVVVANFEDSAVDTVMTIEMYLELITDTIQSRYKGYMNDENLTKYFSGVLDVGAEIDEETGEPIESSEKANIRKTYTTEINDNVNSDELLEDMMFISDQHTSFGTTTVTEGAYEAYMATENGQKIADKPYKFYWFGNNCEADELIGSNGNFYAMRLVRKIDNCPALMMIDIDIEVVIDSLDALDPGDGGFVALVTGDGAEVFSSHNRTEAKTIFSDEQFYKDAMAAEAIEGKQYVTYNGEDYVFIYRKVGDLDMMICGLIAESYLVNKVNDILVVTIILVVIASIVAIATGVVLANGISKTIKHIVKKLKKVSEGDFTVTIGTKRKDEFKLVTGAVNETVAHVKELIASVQDVNEELVKAADRVYSSSALFMETTQNIQSSVDEIKTGAYKLDEDSDNCLVQMDKLSEKIETVTTNTEEISKVVDTTNESIVAGIGSIEGVTESTEATTRITGEVIDAIENLQEQSRSIGNIVKVINDIAEQTNLLSLNASIEAARAGEAGRGFAVVASEISKLADQSLGSADQIRKIIEEILNNTGKVVDIAKEAFAIVQEQNKSVAGTTEAFEEMKQNISVLLQSLEEITQNVINMEGARAMTLESIENISAVSAETAACSVSVAETVDSQNKAIYDLDTAANTLSNKSSQLTELLTRFTV